MQENTRGLASTNRLTYSDVVNLSMNQVLARSINTSLVAILPILSILVIGAWVLGATALQDFGLALFVGLTTGAYSSIFIASPSAGAAQGTRAPLRRDPPPAGRHRPRPVQAHHSRRRRHRRPERRRAGGRGCRLRPPPGRAAVPGRSGRPRPADGSGVVTQDRADGPEGAAPSGGPTTGAQPATGLSEQTPDGRPRVGGDLPPESGERPASVKSRNRPKSRNPLNRRSRRAGVCGLPAADREPASAGPAVPPRAGNRPAAPPPQEGPPALSGR